MKVLGASRRKMGGQLGRLRLSLESGTELGAHLATASTEHLDELTALPNVAVRHFKRELAAVSPAGKKIEHRG